MRKGANDPSRYANLGRVFPMPEPHGSRPFLSPVVALPASLARGTDGGGCCPSSSDVLQRGPVLGAGGTLLFRVAPSAGRAEQGLPFLLPPVEVPSNGEEGHGGQEEQEHREGEDQPYKQDAEGDRVERD